MQVHHRTILCSDGCHCWKYGLAQVGCCERKENVKSFPAEVGELPSEAHPKFGVRLPRKLTLKEVSDIMSTLVSSSREQSKFWGELTWIGSVIRLYLSLTASGNTQKTCTPD